MMIENERENIKFWYNNNIIKRLIIIDFNNLKKYLIFIFYNFLFINLYQNIIIENFVIIYSKNLRNNNLILIYFLNNY